ncbi:hypothetical protein V492_05677 [Pseudogymnoascus sp. VKM F-4246]|nr:hypothetical protein V492_05677 [Pseudogymnoascus sp. VKM F-4246]
MTTVKHSGRHPMESIMAKLPSRPIADLFRDDLNSSWGKDVANQGEAQPCAKYVIQAEKFILNYVARLGSRASEDSANTKTGNLGLSLETEKLYYKRTRRQAVLVVILCTSSQPGQTKKHQMSIPPELRALNHQLATVPTAQLPQIAPLLLRNVLRCQGPLSSPSTNATKDDGSDVFAVHKLKNHVKRLLEGKSAEGRFAAIILVKGIIDVGGWEVLREALPWVRGLLAILTKPDPIASKRLCIITLSSIFVKTHQYQSIVREITTPFLPPFVTSCLALISSKSTGKVLEVPASLTESIFDSFSTLMPRHPAIFRPFAGQIRQVTRVYVAPTFCDGFFIPESLKESARSLSVLLHQTAPKNTSGEEWGKNVRELVKEIHTTTDQVYRAVVEDWESSAGYVPQPIDVNEELHGGGKSKDDYPAWTGVDAGLERLQGLLGYLEEHFKHHTATAVTVPLGIVDDLLTRLMSIAAPQPTRNGSGNGGMRLHPAISREEREGLWSGLPQTYIGVMEVYGILIERLQHNFTSLAQGCLEQITWTFRTGKQDERYRAKAYDVIAATLPLCASGLPKPSVDRLTPAIISCCKELRTVDEVVPAMALKDSSGKAISNGVANADSFLKNKSILASADVCDTAVVKSAKALLPLFFTLIPQQHLEAYTRAELDRTAILSHHKEAMLASVLSPFLGRNGKSLPSILPHLCRAYPRDAAVEALLRPRLPVIRQTAPVMGAPLEEELDEDDDVAMDDLQPVDGQEELSENTNNTTTTSITTIKEANYTDAPITSPKTSEPEPNHWGTSAPQNKRYARKDPQNKEVAAPATSISEGTPRMETTTRTTVQSTTTTVDVVEEDSDDESVHLEAGLSDSDEEEE